MGSIKKKIAEQNQNNSVLDAYSNKVFRLVVMIVPFFFLCGNGTMTIMHYMGYYPSLNDVAMWCSNAVDIMYLLIAVFLVKTSYGPDGLLDSKRIPVAKIVLLGMVVLQWNLNSYICPFEDFWAYAPLFVIIEAFFFDVVLVHWATLLIVVSMAVSWMVNGEHLLPAPDDFFLLNLIFRGVGLTFTLLCINILTYFGKAFIIEMIETREKEREMREMSLEYEREARMKSDFLANMSHEIRTPMNAVIGMAEIAMREDLPPAAVDCLTQIQKSGRNLLNIINDILDYSKIDSGKLEIVQEEYIPSEEISDIANILATRIADKKLDIYISTDSNLPHSLLGDAMRIRQVLINLVNNAIKFTPEGSVAVLLSCEFTEDNMVNLTYHIKDTGIGIKEEDLEKLFASFQQVDSRRNRSVEGTGLGLAISKQLVELMGGTIGVSSVYGEGSDFWFTIPQKIVDPTSDFVIEDAKGKRAIMMDEDPIKRFAFKGEVSRLFVDADTITKPEEYRPSGKVDYLFFEHDYYNEVKPLFEKYPELHGAILIPFSSDFTPEWDRLKVVRRPMTTMGIVRVMNDDNDIVRASAEEEAYEIEFIAPEAKILVVDDNAINITIAEGLLAPMRMQVDAALSGQEAIDKIKEKNYDIVLMDHMMPVMDGVDTTKIIRSKIADEDHLTIIALSANALESSCQMFLDSGMNDFVAKPIEIKELVAKLKKWLPDDKIIKGHVEAKTSSDMSDDPLLSYKGLNSKKAIAALGSIALYVKIVGEYYRSGREKLDGIRLALANDDIGDYTIRVHALKSSSRQIGAYILGDMAEHLEMAGKAGDRETVDRETEGTLSAYEHLLDDLSEYFPKEEAGEKPPYNRDEMVSQINRLISACEELDLDGMEAVKTELAGYAYPEKLQSLMDELMTAIDDIDVDVCSETAEKLLAEGE